MNEEKLNELARRLGAQPAERIDVEATAREVLERLRSERRLERWRWIRPAWLRVAAAVVVLLGAAVLVRDRMDPEVAGAVAAIPTGADLGSLSTSELQELLGTLDQTLDLAVPLPRTSENDLEGLSEQQLRTVLESLEG